MIQSESGNPIMESEEKEHKADTICDTTRTSISDQMAKTAIKALNEASRKWREEQEKKHK